jgi:hypothetical protein
MKQQWCTQGFFLGGVQQIQLRTKGKENGDLGAVAHYSGVPLNLQMSETRILIRLLRIRLSFVKTSEFWGVGVGLNPPPPSVCHCEAANTLADSSRLRPVQRLSSVSYNQNPVCMTYGQRMSILTSYNKNTIQSATDFSRTNVTAQRHGCSKVTADRNSVVIIIS